MKTVPVTRGRAGSQKQEQILPMPRQTLRYYASLVLQAPADFILCCSTSRAKFICASLLHDTYIYKTLSFDRSVTPRLQS